MDKSNKHLFYTVSYTFECMLSLITNEEDANQKHGDM